MFVKSLATNTKERRDFGLAEAFDFGLAETSLCLGLHLTWVFVCRTLDLLCSALLQSFQVGVQTMC